VLTRDAPYFGARAFGKRPGACSSTLAGSHASRIAARHPAKLGEMITFFERLLPDGWIYPCTIGDLSGRVSELPSDDVAGLCGVGLVPATRKDKAADARYFPGDRPAIHVYSYPASFALKLPSHTKASAVERDLADALTFGMRLERVGSRLFCRWQPANLRAYLLEHVLLHEIGHHAYHVRRVREGLTTCPNVRVCEQHADAYARRHRRLICAARQGF